MAFLIESTYRPVLTEATARALEPPDELPQATDRLVFDGGTGLALRVLPSGLKTWLWQGRMRAGRVVRLTLGEWGQQGLSVRQARRLAAEVRSRVHAGRLDTGLTATTSEPRCRAF